MSAILRYKLVKTRKPHVCFGCGRCFEPPWQMISATVADGTIRSYYLCRSCNKVAFDLGLWPDFGFGDLREAALETALEVAFDLGLWPDFGFGDLREAALEYEKEQNTIVKGEQNND